MKKFLYLLLCVLLVFPMLFGCAPTKALEPFPLLEDDTESESPLGLFGDTVYGIVTKTDNSGITLELQNKTFFFKWTPITKRHYDGLGIQIGNEVSIQYDVKNNTYIAIGIDLIVSD